ncbi:MAG: flagellar protein FlaG [Pseudomonadota bacterium]|nr:flagellar protein FlaG [Pseudomonadota bacterium]
MASDGILVKPSAAPLPPAQGSKPTAVAAHPSSGQPLPANATNVAGQAALQPLPPARPPPDLHAIVAQLNKHLQDSGRPNQYRLDSSSGRKVIQEINPDTDQVIGEMPASEFKALAQELGISGLLVDAHA